MNVFRLCRGKTVDAVKQSSHAASKPLHIAPAESRFTKFKNLVLLRNFRSSKELEADEEFKLNQLIKVSALMKSQLPIEVVEKDKHLKDTILAVHERVEKAPFSTKATQHIKSVIEELALYNEKSPSKIEELMSLSSGNENDIIETLNVSSRIGLLTEYLKSILNFIHEGDIKECHITPNTILGLVDCILLGSSSERIAVYLNLFNTELTPFSFQSAFNSFLEAEVNLMSNYINNSSATSKKLVEATKKFHKTYLFDNLEANTKIRSVFAWSDPHYKGYNPLSEDMKLSRDLLLVGRKKWFLEAEDVSERFVISLRGERRLHYQEWKNFKVSAAKGAAYFFVTCILDFIICTI